MEEIVKLQDKDLIPIDGARVFVGGICTGNQIVPEHYFVEVYYGKDDPRNMTLDTFINQRAPVIVSKPYYLGSHIILDVKEVLLQLKMWYLWK